MQLYSDFDRRSEALLKDMTFLKLKMSLLESRLKRQRLGKKPKYGFKLGLYKGSTPISK
jgi:hypothetical protein